MKLLFTIFFGLSISLVNAQIKPEVYDELGNLIQRNRVNENGEYVKSEDENFIVQKIYKYDSLKNMIEESYRNIKGELIPNGISIRKYKYENGRKIEDAFYNAKDSLEENFLGFAIVRFEFDENGRETERRFLDSSKKLTVDEEYGVAITKTKYDSEGRVIELRHFDNNQQLVKPYNTGAVVQVKYDDNGQVIEEREYNSDEELIRILNKSTTQFLRIKLVTGFPDWFSKNVGFYNITNGVNDKGMFTFRLRFKNDDLKGKVIFEVELDEEGTVNKFKLIESDLKKKKIKSFYEIFENMKFIADEKFIFEKGMKGRVNLDLIKN